MGDDWAQVARRYVAGDPRLLGSMHRRLDGGESQVEEVVEPHADARPEHHVGMEADTGPAFVRFEDERWLDDDRAERVDDWCFLCEYSQDSTEFDGNRDYARLLKLIKDHYGKTKPDVLSQMIQQFYNRFLRDCIERPREWSKRSIYYHVERHCPDPYNMTVDAVRTITNAMHLLKDRGMCMQSLAPDGQSVTALNASNTRLYLALVDRQQRLIGSINRMSTVQSTML